MEEEGLQWIYNYNSDREDGVFMVVVHRTVSGRVMPQYGIGYGRFPSEAAMKAAKGLSDVLIHEYGMITR